MDVLVDDILIYMMRIISPKVLIAMTELNHWYLQSAGDELAKRPRDLKFIYDVGIKFNWLFNGVIQVGVLSEKIEKRAAKIGAMCLDIHDICPPAMILHPNVNNIAGGMPSVCEYLGMRNSAYAVTIYFPNIINTVDFVLRIEHEFPGKCFKQSYISFPLFVGIENGLHMEFGLSSCQLYRFTDYTIIEISVLNGSFITWNDVFEFYKKIWRLNCL